MFKALIAGDYCPHARIAQMVERQDYTFFDHIKDFIKQADYSIVNFECPIVEGNAKPIKKCGPALRTISNAVDAVKYAGFNCVTLANNHFRDYGDSGCISTLNELNKQNVDYVGGGKNLQEAQQILYKEINGKKLAIVNFCENEFSIATANSAGAAPLDTADNFHQITNARKNADYVLVIIHGGHEHYQLPSPRMKKLYRYFVELGADAVVNHHQHCFSGYEYYNGKPIVYGLGNFCFDSKSLRNQSWNEGYFVTIDFNTPQPSLQIYPYRQCDDEATVNVLNSDAQHHFNNKLRELNEIIQDDARLQNSFDEWVNGRERWVYGLFNSYHNRYLNAAASRGWLPRPASDKEIGVILNYISCEAHRDIVLDVLKQKFNKR